MGTVLHSMMQFTKCLLAIGALSLVSVHGVKIEIVKNSDYDAFRVSTLRNGNKKERLVAKDYLECDRDDFKATDTIYDVKKQYREKIKQFDEFELGNSFGQNLSRTIHLFRYENEAEAFNTRQFGEAWDATEQQNVELGNKEIVSTLLAGWQSELPDELIYLTLYVAVGNKQGTPAQLTGSNESDRFVYSQCQKCGGKSKLMFACNDKHCSIKDTAKIPCPDHKAAARPRIWDCTNHGCELAKNNESVAYNLLEPFIWDGVSRMPTGFLPQESTDWFQFFKTKNPSLKANDASDAFQKLYPERRRRLTASQVLASAPHRRLVVLERLLEDIKRANYNRDH